MKIIARLFTIAFTLLLVSKLVPGIEVENIYVALIAAVVLAVLNLLVKPILVVLTLPITIITLGLFMFVINAGLFIFAAYFVGGFSVQGFLPALVGSIIVSLVSTWANHILS